MAKINQSGRLLVALLGKLAGLLMKVAVTLAKNVLAALVPMVSASAVNGAIQRRMHGRDVVKTNKQKKGITIVISNKDMDDIIRINKSLKNSSISITWVIETEKYEVSFMDSLWYVASNFRCIIVRKYFNWEKSKTAGRGYNNMNHEHNFFYFCSIL